MQGWQAGSVIGFAALPVVTFVQYRKGVPLTAGNLQQPALKTLGIAAASGFALLAVAGTARVSQLPMDGIEDRAYRLKYNAGQNRTDLFSNYGAAVGTATVAGILGPTPYTILGGAALGTFLGLIAHVLTSTEEKKQANAMLEEAKTLLQKN